MSSAGIEPVVELLVIRLGSLGDLVLTFPALALLRQRSPGARIVLLTREAYAPLAAAHESVDEVIPVSPSATGVLSSLRLALELRRRRFAAVYDLHSSPRSRLVTALSGSPLRRWVGKRALARGSVHGVLDRRLPRRHPARRGGTTQAVREDETLAEALRKGCGTETGYLAPSGPRRHLRGVTRASAIRRIHER